MIIIVYLIYLLNRVILIFSIELSHLVTATRLLGRRGEGGWLPEIEDIGDVVEDGLRE
jgi:hypothetical protein